MKIYVNIYLYIGKTKKQTINNNLFNENDFKCLHKTRLYRYIVCVSGIYFLYIYISVCIPFLTKRNVENGKMLISNVYYKEKMELRSVVLPKSITVELFSIFKYSL